MNNKEMTPVVEAKSLNINAFKDNDYLQHSQQIVDDIGDMPDFSQVTGSQDHLSMINAQLESFAQESKEIPSEIGMFIIKSANRTCIEEATKPVPEPLASIDWTDGEGSHSTGLWYEGECSCLFADSNVGKSILAVQIASEIAKHRRCIYFDFELSDKQFQLRYSDEETHTCNYPFPEDLYRVSLNPDNIDPNHFEENIISNIEMTILQVNAKVIIIDNLTFLCSATEKGDLAGSLMMKLITLRKKHDLSMLVLAHTPKRPLTKAIDQNDLAGSKKLFNFFRSAFAIGFSAKSPELRYIKQVKVTNGPFRNGSDNVVVCEIVKDTDNFLKFSVLSVSNESEHLKEATEEDKMDLQSEVIRLFQEGDSIRTIASKTGMSSSSVGRMTKAFQDQLKVSHVRHGTLEARDLFSSTTTKSQTL